MSLLSDQLRRRIKLHDLATVKHDNAVAVEDSIDPVRDGDDCAMLEDATSEHLLKESVGFNVDGGLENGAGVSVLTERGFCFKSYRRFVQNQDVAGREKCSGERYELPLSLAQVGS